MDAPHFLGKVRRRLSRVILLEGASRVLLLLLSLCAAIVLADYCWPTPGWFRLAALLALIAAVGLATRVRLIRPLTRAMDDRALAQFVERRLPALDGRLLTLIDGIPLAHESQALEAALHPAAVQALVPARLMPRWLAGAGFALLLVFGVAVSAPRFFSDACARLLLPLGSTQWARGTTLDAHLERGVVACDRKLGITIERHHWRASREVADYEAPVLVSWEGLDGAASGHRDARQLPGLRGNSWQAALPALAPGRWRITIESGDALPCVLESLSVSRPSLVTVSATLTPPAYAKLPVQHLSTIACSALPGSQIALHLRFASDPGREIAGASGELAVGDAISPLELTRDGDGFAAHLAVKPGQPIQVVLHATDGDGIGIDPPPSFTITPLEDHPPTVALSGPQPTEAVTVHAKVPIIIDATDDFALAKLELHAQVGAARSTADAPAGDHGAAPAVDSAAAPKSIATFPDAAGAAATTRRAVVQIGALAGMGDQLVLTGFATDANDVTGPGQTTSAPILLRVVSDEALRQEIDRLLNEARERASQSREEIGAGLAKPAKLVAAARTARLQAERCAALVDQALRRWGENQFPPEQIQPAADADGLLHQSAIPDLSKVASESALDTARAADGAMAKVEKLLGSLLQEGDLTRRLADLIAKQEHLGEESRAFVLAHLTQDLDEAGRAQQANIAERQKGIAEDVKELEHQILSNASAQLAKAREQVQGHPIGERLNEAAAAIASQANRPQAVQTQSEALADMKKLLEALRGGDAAGDLADRIGALAAREEGLVKDLDAGKNPRAMEQLQKDLAEEMKRLQAEAQQKDDDAGKAVAAAKDAADSAAQGMGQGDRASSARDASASASLLREAQRKLNPDQQQDQKKKDDKHTPDVMRLLRELMTLQSQLVADATIIHQAQGEKPLDFSGSRAVSALGQRQGDILLRLKEEGIKALDQNPIAVIALNRVAAAMDSAQGRLQTPALGIHGMRLLRIALAELKRLIDICDAPTPPSEGSASDGGGQRKGAAFPAQAELALLAAMEEEIAHLTDAARPEDLAKAQADLRDLVEGMERSSRPGTRANILLARTRRAMASAAVELFGKDRGLLTRDEQSDAVAEIRRMMSESNSGGGGGGGGGGGSRGKNKNRPSGNPSPSDSPGSSPSGASPGGGAKSGSKPHDEATEGVIADQRNGPLKLELPDEMRERLKQARAQNLGPRALQLYERYLELLEDDQK
jgi:hypothetical protein